MWSESTSHSEKNCSLLRAAAYPSLRAFFAMVNDPERTEAQGYHRNRALEYTYTVVVRATIDSFVTNGAI